MSKKGTILIVDDNPENIRVLGTILLAQNYHVVVAQDGEQAINALNENKPDLILLDIMMPNMDGFEACKRIKEKPEFEAVSIIFLTAKTEDNEIIKGFELGAADYITKPFNKNILLARVKTHIKLHQYHQRILQLALLDGLTQIPNRFHFDQVLKNEWNRHLRQQNKLAVIMIDIDFFKSINDDYGHLVGDDVLKKIAATLENEKKRAGDFIARYGGEEFAVIVTNTDQGDVSLFAEHLRYAIEALKIPTQNKQFKYVTISLGVAEIVPTQDSSLMQLIDAADKQLYIAKEQGRNQVQVGNKNAT